MIDLHIDVSGFVAWLRQAESQMQANAKQALGQSVALALRNARSTQSFKDHTGKLRSSIVRGERSSFTQFIAAKAPYAAYVEHGTTPHRIEPRKAKALRFVAAGGVRFSRGVNHPGTKPTNFMERAAHAAADPFVSMLERAAAAAFR